MIDKLNITKNEENKSLNNFLENVIRVKNEVNTSDINQSLKADFLTRIDNYKKIAGNVSPSLAITKAQEIDYLNKLVNNELKTLIQETPDKNKLLQNLSQRLNALKAESFDSNIKKLVAMQVQKIQNNPTESEGEILNSISQVTNLATSAENIQDFANEINKQINQHLSNNDLSVNDAKSFKDQLDNITDSSFNQIKQYLEKLNKLYNDIYDNVLLRRVFKSSLKKLDDQIVNALNDELGVKKSDLTQMSAEIQEALNGNVSIKELNDLLRIKSNELREINRIELRNWYKLALTLVEPDSDIDFKIKDTLNFLNQKAVLLIPQDSTAIREEMQFLIAQYQEQHQKANISQGLQESLLKFDKTKEAINLVFGKVNGEISSEFGQKLQQEALELKKQAKIASQNPNLTQEQKQTKFTELIKALDNLAKNTLAFKELELKIAQGEQALASSMGKKSEQTFLEKEALRIKQIKTNALSALNEASGNLDLQNINNQMDDAIVAYKEKQAEYQSTQALQDNFNFINQTFAPYSLGGTPTPIQKKILDKLTGYQKELGSTTLTNEQRDNINANIAALIEVVQAAKDLEVKNNSLKALVNDTENDDYGTFKPDSNYSTAKALNSEVDTFLLTLFNPDFNKEEIIQKTQKLESKTLELGLSISVAKLKKTNKEIQDNKVTGAIASQRPYNQINASIETINTVTENLISDNDKTQAQVDELENNIKNYLKLAKALKASATKLQSITQSDNPITYELLEKSILNKPSSGSQSEPTDTLIHFGDSVSVIDFKTRILTSELSKTSIRIEAENNIKTFKSVYTQTERNDVNYDTAIATWESKISDYKAKIAEFYVTNANLATLKDDINFATQKENQIKSNIKKAYDDAVALKNKLKTEYDQRKTADGLANSTFTDAVFTQFENLQNATDVNGKKTTLTVQLLTKLDELSLSYAKDGFVQSADEIDTKFTPFNNYSTDVKNNYSDGWKTIIINWKNAIRDTVKGYNNASDLVQIKRDYQKISSLNALISQLKTLFDYFDTNSKTTQGQKNWQTLNTSRPDNVLFARLNNKSEYQNADQSTFYSKSSDTILALRNEFRDAYFDVVSLEEAKETQTNKINEYKTAVDNKLDTLVANIDTNLKTQIDAKLQNLLTQTNAVTHKADLINIDNELSALEFKEENLKQLALKSKEANNIISQNNSLSQNETGKQSIITDLTNTYNSYKDGYLNLSAIEIISKEKGLENKIALFNKFTAVYAQVQSDKTNIPDVSNSTNGYATGTGAQGTAQDGKLKIQGYYDHLTQMLNEIPVTQNKLFNVQNTLASLKKLIDLQKDKLNEQNQVLTDNSYNNFTYKSRQNAANYGFDQDAKLLADAILKSIPDNNKTATELETELIPNLVNEFQNAKDLYLARKVALDSLYKDDANQKGIKVKETEQLYSANTTTVDSQFTELKEKADDFFHARAEEIKNATNKAAIDESIRNAIEIDVFFEKYKILAELVAKANTAKATAQNNTAIAQNPNITGSIAKLDAEITKATGYYYTQKDSSLLDNNIFLLDTFIERLKFATQIATTQNDLNNFNTNPGNDDYLTSNAKTPLANILNKPFEELNANPALESKENYAQLLDKYITGSSNASYNIAFINSKILQANIHKAQEYLTSYKAKIASNSNYEPQNIKDLYTALETKITEATRVLEASDHNEGDKLRFASELYNSNNGALDEILKAESAKVKAAYALHLDLDKYLTNNYPNAQSTPRMNDYVQTAVDAIKNIDISTAIKLETFNTTLASAITKYEDQRLAIFKWEANRYNSYKAKFNEFYDFLNASNTNGASKEFVLKVTGITQAELDNFNSAANPSAADALHTNAQSYATKSTDTDANIKTFLEANANIDIIGTLSSVANEFFNYYQNLISIKSIPSILLGISNFTRIKNEFTDNSQDHNVRFALKNTNSETAGLTTKITEYLADLANITNDSANQVQTQADDSNISFASATDAQTTQARTSYFNTYKDIVVAIAKAKEKLDEIVFGTNANDNDTLQKVLHKFIEGETGFDGRANLANLLKFIGSNSQNAANLASNDDKFTLVKNEYSKIATPSIEGENALNTLTKSATDIDIYSTITRGFSIALQLFNWTNNSNNTNLFFDFLSQSNAGKLNYENISPKDTTSLETFKEKLDGINGLVEEDVEIDGTMYKAKKLNSSFDANGGGLLGDLFDSFNILKGVNNFFNTTNVEVFAYKSAALANSEYVASRLTSDPSIKRGFMNLFFRFTKPASLNNNDSAFGSVTNFGIKFENVGINFKTLDEFVISKENIQDTGKLQETLFSAEQAGWNNLQAPVRLFGAFNKYSTLKLLKDNKYYFTEGVNESIDAPASNTTNSSPNFRIKVKLSSSYRGYTQSGTTIFWKTLNPNFASDSGIQHQNGNSYKNAVLSQANRNTYMWEQNYQYQYQQNLDQGKNLLFLPIVIGIPAFDAQGNAAMIVITWQILNRFDKEPSAAVQNISLGNSEVLRHVDIYKRTTAGISAAATSTLPAFYDYVMTKIKIRDLASLAFDNLSNSGLWSGDRNIQKDNNNSGKGRGIAEQEFITAIGSNGRFDIKFKLH
ncbi:Uncharacterised protein [Mycoplasmopsis citelli]|uniref:Uncharacterized protein n=1 Tax=Mycoplasmopsis citelli TaxID=171281 RepID=A0A449B172_9BACT|nr:hypothetical protein [Mycoplasmopsis citelli]VEU74349.1 Uncharacterised protein [Mycoplasmopsis citelli]